MNFLYVMIGGALGSALRYAVAVAFGKWLGAAFPYGTFCVNVLGAFLMGALIGWLTRFMPVHAAEWRVFLAVGVLGGFTTFSSFALDAVLLMENGQWGAMAFYVFGSVAGALAGLFAGLSIMRNFA